MTGWWTCTGCGVDAALPATDTVGFVVECPDCAGSMVELWCWEAGAAPAPGYYAPAA